MAASTSSKGSGISALIKHKASLHEIDKTGLTALHIAAGYNNVEEVKILLSAGAPINVTNEQCITPLLLASKCNSTEMVELLLSKGAHIIATKEGETPTKEAIAYRNKNMLAALLKDALSEVKEEK